MENHFLIEVVKRGGSTVVAVAGELDLESSPALDDELARLMNEGEGRLILDLRQLDFMDSTGLSTLVRAQARLQEAGRKLGVVRGTQQVQRLLELTSVADRLDFADTPEEFSG